jgi:catechol 2,3-dioxygenase-like lactoylglutathione lyase family enzyme
MDNNTKIRMEGITLTVDNGALSIDYYVNRLGFKLELDAKPHFALIRVGCGGGDTIGLLAWSEAEKEGSKKLSTEQKRSIHVELSTDDLDGLYEELKANGLEFHSPPHDEPWERSMTAFDVDGYSVEFAQGRRGKNKT